MLRKFTLSRPKNAPWKGTIVVFTIFILTHIYTAVKLFHLLSTFWAIQPITSSLLCRFFLNICVLVAESSKNLKSPFAQRLNG